MILFCDGFDHYNAGNLSDKWDYVDSHAFGWPSISADGRFGGRCLTLSDSWSCVQKWLPLPQMLIAGMAVNPIGLNQPLFLMMFFREDHLLADVRLSTSGHIQFWCGKGGLSGSNVYEKKGESIRPIRLGAFTYIEAKILFDKSCCGTAVVHVQEEEVINLSGLDTGYDYNPNLLAERYDETDAISVGEYRRRGVRTDFGPGTPLIDDFYVADNSGGVLNDFLGDITMNESLPISDGFYTEFARSAGTDGYALVDDPYNAVNESDYVAASAVGKRDTYNFPALSTAAGSVCCVAMNYYVTKTDSGVRKIKALARMSGTDANGTEINVLTGYAFFQSFLTLDPGGSPWSISSVNSSEFGQEISV